MSAHLEPEKFDSPELSADEQAHLSSCTACAQTRRDAAARRKMLGGLTPYTLSDMAFRRVEARLMEQVDQGLTEPAWWRRVWWLGPVVAAVAVALWVGRPSTQAETPIGPTHPQLVAARVEPLTVLQASGGSRVRRGTEWTPVHAGELLVTGDAFTGELRLATAGETSWTFEVWGSAAVGGAGSLALGVGEVRGHVAGLEATIFAGGLQVLATDAAFLVSSTAAEVLVEVSEGEVSLRDSLSGVRTLKAPARVRWAPGSKPVSLPVVGVPVVGAPAKPWVRFDAMSLPANVRVTLDGLEVGVAPLELLTSKGRHRIGVAASGGALQESWVELTGDYSVSPDVLKDAPHEAPPPDEAALARVQAELTRNIPKLAACYEKWLKENANAAADVVLRLVVSEKGRVKRAQIVGRDLSPVSAECLERTAKALVLPALGSEVEFELPIKLTTGR